MLSKRSITQVGISALISAIFGSMLVAGTVLQGGKDVRLADAAMQGDKDGVAFTAEREGGCECGSGRWHDGAALGGVPG